MKSKKLWVTVLLCGAFGASWGAQDALITSLAGTVHYSMVPTNVLRPFLKLRDGDKLTFKDSARLQIVFFGSGRQETWVGQGSLEIGDGHSKVLQGDLKAEVKQLPAVLVKQLTKTPTVDEVGRVGMTRLRTLHTDGALDAIEKAYADFRSQTSDSDFSPELYLLNSYLELREFDKVSAKLQELQKAHPNDPEVSKLNTLYQGAIASAKR
ncbi:MAG: hypothetical protein K9K38_19075 [Rhodoferax sp.]|nr:hypothetical protein [Rhodoferax sp.]MCF8211481.1 hypothetical protein [Rhodoferax sp.]